MRQKSAVHAGGVASASGLFMEVEDMVGCVPWSSRGVQVVDPNDKMVF
jgi:hypothetical protein